MFSQVLIMEACNIDEAVKYASAVMGYSKLREYQIEALNGFAAGRDCFVCIPTGGGKSAVYECAPFVMHYLATGGNPSNTKVNKTVLIISPLVSLMRTQCADLVERSICVRYELRRAARFQSTQCVCCTAEIWRDTIFVC